jgi:multidrug efflux pump subunit AcrA (membrane-fusion protein)
MKKLSFFILILFIFSCKSKVEKVKPEISSISESIYASGIIKSKDQYEVFATVNGIIENIYVSEGDSVKKGAPILSISNETQKLNKENAQLAAHFSDFNENQGKLNESKLLIDLSKNKMKNDSVLFFRQKDLWDKQVGSKVDLEQRELAYQNSKAAYYSSVVRYDDLKRQLRFTSTQSQKNLQISSKQESDFTLKSEIEGVVYDLYKLKGEMVGIQTPLAVIGDSKHFILEMQVDEYDIFRIRKGLAVLVSMDSYKGKVFEAQVTKIYPIMNDRSKTFLVEAEFIDSPEILYPNITFEANIVLSKKNNAILIPRSFLLNDTIVVKSNGDKVIVKTGLKDYQKVEIISGISADDELIKPTE